MLDGVIIGLTETVPLDAFFARNLKDELAEAPAPLYLTPTCTKFIGSADPIAAGVSSMFTSSI